MVWGTDVVRIVVGVGVLAFAAVADIRWRRAPDVCWWIVAGTGVLVLGIDATLTDAFWSTNLAALVTSALILILAVGGYLVGLIAGGADAKALASLAILAPMPLSDAFAMPLGGPLPLVVTALMNALILAMIVPVALTLLNLARGDLDGFRTILGFRTSLDRVDLRVVWPLEYVGEDGERYAANTPGGVPLDAFNPERMREHGLERVWVTPKVPFLVPLCAGFVAAVLVGDPFASLLEQVIGQP